MLAVQVRFTNPSFGKSVLHREFEIVSHGGQFSLDFSTKRPRRSRLVCPGGRAGGAGGAAGAAGAGGIEEAIRFPPGDAGER